MQSQPPVTLSPARIPPRRACAPAPEGPLSGCSGSLEQPAEASRARVVPRILPTPARATFVASMRSFPSIPSQRYADEA